MMKISDDFIRLYGTLEEAYAEFKTEILSIPKEDPDRDDLLIEKVHECEPIRRNCMTNLGQITMEFKKPEKEVHRSWIQKSEHWKSIQDAPFCRRIINKPEGYPGDHKLMDMIYQNRLEGKSNWGKFIHKQAVETEACQAVRNRREFLSNHILELNRGGG